MSNILSLSLRYFPFPGRAGPIRDALNIGGIKFEDVHIPPDEFRQRRKAGEFPFGGLPVLDIESTQGKVCAAQSNAILRFAGRLSGLYPVDDPVKALKVDEAMDMGEDINALLGPSLHEADEAKRMAMRKTLAEETLPFWAACFEKLLNANGNTGFIVGDSLTVADLKLYWIIEWLTCGMLDGIPTSLVDSYPAIQTWRKQIGEVREAQLAVTA
ncbi:MAG: glutathione S-transferase [Gammaproteobacteria bacterium]